MFFILSKTLGALAKPLVVIVMLFVSALLVRNKRWKRRLLIIAVTLLLFCSNEFISNEVMRWWELPPTPFSEMKTYQVGILLTGVTKSNFNPNDRVYFQRSSDRVTHTLQLYKLGLIKKILISGGSGTLTTRTKEADELSIVLQMMGVPAADLIIENQSDNTHESAVAVKQIIEGVYPPSDCLLITSGYHMRRSRACFKKVGYDIDTFSVDFLSNKREFNPDTLLLPKIESLFNWQVVTKEWVGMVAYKMAGYI